MKNKKREDKNRNKEHNRQKTVTSIVHINPTISVVTLNVSGLMHQLKEVVKVDQKTTGLLSIKPHFKYISWNTN